MCGQSVIESPIVALAPSKSWLAAEKPVLLTFEAGPSENSTSVVLDTLAKYQIKAVFFVVARHLRKAGNLAMVKRMLFEGHMVGNNSYSHVDLTNKSPKRIYSEIADAQVVLEDLGVAEKLFRPPFGRVNEDVFEVARYLGYAGLGWNADTLDWAQDYKPTRWITRGVDQVCANPQSIVRLHDGNFTTAKGLATFIEELLRIGYSYPWLFGGPSAPMGSAQLWKEAHSGWLALAGLPMLRPAQTAPASKATEPWLERNKSTGKKKAIFCLSKQQWNDGYTVGHWNYLRGTEEVARYAVIFGLLLHMKANKDVLDVGCGEGVLLDYLKICGYHRYLGLDLSEVAIQKSSLKADTRTEFALVDAEVFDPGGAFDCMVFSECLYCFSNPLDVLERYRRSLKKDGVFIITLFVGDSRVARLARQVRRRYRCLEQVELKNARGRWVCSLFANELER
jgi:peptidoglycan/xylan/chitin deacetylase (PgdA/CDA1 family)/SAM-dependent methyltransferase